MFKKSRGPVITFALLGISLLLAACGGQRFDIAQISSETSGLVPNSLKLDAPTCKRGDSERFKITGETVRDVILRLDPESSNPSVREEAGDEVFKDTYAVPSGKSFSIEGPLLYGGDEYRFNLVEVDTNSPQLAATLTIKWGGCAEV